MLLPNPSEMPRVVLSLRVKRGKGVKAELTLLSTNLGSLTH